MNNMTTIFFLTGSVSDSKGWHGASSFSLKEPSWNNVEDALSSVFNSGGAVRLQLLERSEGLEVLTDMIFIEAKIRRYRLVVSPLTEFGERSQMREWWDPTNTAFTGFEVFNDHEWKLLL